MALPVVKTAPVNIFPSSQPQTPHREDQYLKILSSRPGPGLAFPTRNT